MNSKLRRFLRSDGALALSYIAIYVVVLIPATILWFEILTRGRDTSNNFFWWWIALALAITVGSKNRGEQNDSIETIAGRLFWNGTFAPALLYLLLFGWPF